MNYPTSVIQTHSLSIGYLGRGPQNIVASSIDLNLQGGRLISLLGVNGIGKSTLLRSLCGIQPLLAGSISLGGRDLSSFSSVDLAQYIAVVLTEKLPPSQLSVYELVALGRLPYTDWMGNLTDVDRQWIHQALEATETLEWAERKWTSLSDGQMQKVLIARAIAQNTPIIILDEPASHLDLYNKILLFKLLKKLCTTQNKCILLSTHEMDLALQLSDEIVLMKPGTVNHDRTENLIEQGAFDHLFDDRSIQFNSEQRRFTLVE